MSVRAQGIGRVSRDRNDFRALLPELPAHLIERGLFAMFREHDQHVIRVRRLDVRHQQQRIDLMHRYDPEQRQASGKGA